MTAAMIASSIEFAPMDEAALESVLFIERQVHTHPWTRGNFLDSLWSGHTALLMRHAGILVGYAVIMPLPGEAELLNIAIEPGHQRMGLGASLLEHVCAAARAAGAARMHLEVRQSNHAARALYLRKAFTEVGMRRDYYAADKGGRENALLMARDL